MVWVTCVALRFGRSAGSGLFVESRQLFLGGMRLKVCDLLVLQQSFENAASVINRIDCGESFGYGPCTSPTRRSAPLSRSRLRSRASC